LQVTALETFIRMPESKEKAACCDLAMLRFNKFLAVAGLLVLLWFVAAVRQEGTEVFVPATGGKPGPVRILRFYASAGVLLTGEKAQLCYGVENAKSVRIAPMLSDVFPAAKRCFEIVPKHTTHYTILAEGFDGKVAMQSLTLAVQAPAEPPPVKLQFASSESPTAPKASATGRT
jgi:hypothetical protein